MFLLTIDKPDEPPIILPSDLAVLIGRGDSCDVQLQDPTLSRVHCRVVANSGRVTLYDAGSRWGTFVNDRRVTECDLRPGDRVRIGETTLQLELEPEVNQTTMAPLSVLLQSGELVDPRSAQPERVFVDDDSAGDSVSQDNAIHICNFQDVPGHFPRFPERRFTSSDFLGTTFHRYQVLRLISESECGIVFYAEMLSNRSPLALKIFRPAFFKSDVEEQRFTRAVNTMFGKRHANIVELLNAGRWHGWIFTASEYIEGVSALELIRRIGILGMLPPTKVLQVGMDLCESLRFAERNEIIHRNIRPSNILIRKADGTTLLNDLILARGIDTSDSPRLTNAGEILGDVSYMSPEQLGSGYLLDHRSDIYQLGATLYALLSGHPPSDGGTVANTIMQILTVNPKSPRIRNLSIPAQLDSVIMKMLAKNPRDRYQSAQELASALEYVVKETQQHRVRAVEVDPRATGWKGALDGLL